MRVPVTIFCKYAFYILMLFGTWVRIKPRTQGSLELSERVVLQTLSRVLIGYEFRLLPFANKTDVRFLHN